MKNLFKINPFFKIKQPIAFLLLAGIIFSSCDPNRVFEKNIVVENSSWPLTEQVCFNVEIADTLSLNNFYLNIRHTTDYKYSNIFLFLNIGFPDGNNSRDTIELTLADIDGRWFGEGMGKIKESQILINKGIVFPEAGNYTFCFEQAMRTVELKGIEDIGIRIEKSN